MTTRRRLLWIGDAVAATGFARCTHGALDVLRETWDVHCLGINADGDPHDWPYPIYPAARAFRPEDAFGCQRARELVARLKPDLVVILQDPWNIPRYVELIRERDETVPIVGWIAVDGRNCRGEALNGLSKAILWTRFGEAEARRGGCTIPTAVVPLGVDFSLFRPVPPAEARAEILPTEHSERFVVGAVGRNQPRKRLDLTIDYFAEWLRGPSRPDATLLLHVAPTGDAGWDLAQLGRYYGLKGRMILRRPNFYHGVEDADMPAVYSAMDAYVSTTQGEGWGLTAMEAMACGVPCVLPDWAAYGEWAKPAARLVRCSEVCYTPVINAQGGIADRAEFIAALDELYADRALRTDMSRRGLALVESMDSWRSIGWRFRAEIEDVRRVEAPAPGDEEETLELVRSANG